ncbi:MAG: D-alanyl-D-alanine carboxypeptidase [Lachnospiraceae bacterium]|nr:D-alanyl-D-alanine carboxypeptidase [Lachnospiraceae bacterium]
MKRNTVKGLVGLIFGCVIIGSLFPAKPVQAENYWPSGIEVESNAAIVMDQNTGTILYQKNETDAHYPASITKIMTALVAIEHSDMKEEVTFSQAAVDQSLGGTSSIARDLNEVMTMEQCLYGMMLESANECAYAIGEHVGGGDINTFVQMMNERAKELGCKNTHFSNPNGLHKEDHYTCAYDMALIARAAYSNQVFAKITGTRAYQIPPTNKHSDITYLNNHHCMLNTYKTTEYLYEYCVGGKTGFTDEANATLVTYAKKNGMTLICVVMDVDRTNQYVDTTNLFNYCFDNFTQYEIEDNEGLSDNVSPRKLGALGTNIELVEIQDGLVILPKTANLSQAEIAVEAMKEEENPAVVGQLKYTYAGRYVGEAKLLYNKNESGGYPFHNLSVEEGGSDVAYYRVDFLTIFGVILGVVGGIFLIVFLIRKADELSTRIHRYRAERRDPNRGLHRIKTKRPRRRRRR